MLVDGAPISASLFDFGLFFFHNVATLIDPAPALLLPAEDGEPPGGAAVERRLRFAQEELGIPHGTIRATVLIETILAAFEMDEILYELRDHSAGLNCGRWDYISASSRSSATAPISCCRTAPRSPWTSIS